MAENGTYPSMLFTPVTGGTDPSTCFSPAYPHDAQGSDAGSTPHNETCQPPKLEGASPTSPRKEREKPPFKCEDCPDLEFAHKSSRERHRQGKHKDRLPCSQPDCPLTWQASRRSEFEDHLRNKHKLKGDKIADEVERILELSHPTVLENDLTHANHASLPVIPSASVAYNSELGQAEPDVTSTEPEDFELEHLAATHAPSRLFLKEDIARLGGYHKIHGWFPFPSVHPRRSTTADIPPNPGIPYIHALPSPVGGYHTSPVPEDSPSLPWTDAAQTLADASSRWGELGN